MSYLGDFRLADTVYCDFTTVDATGVPTTLGGTPVISAYPNDSTTQLTAGITLTADFDGVTGLNHIKVVATSGNGYAIATDYTLVITTGTVGGVSVVGYVVGVFSVENRWPSTAAANRIADQVLRRTYANAHASGDGDTLNFRSLLGSVAKLVNLVQVSGGNLLITHEDDTTTFGTQAITTQAGADPIVKLDTQ